ncbi:MAG: alpha/beta hydrolase [Pseudomonadota bacterium]
MLLIFLALSWAAALPASAQDSPFPPGFQQSQLADPVSGLPVQVALSRKPGAPWVVLIHGLGQQAARDWLPVLPALAADYQVMVFDLPGFGASPAPDAALTPTGFADLVHSLVSRQTEEPVFVVGHSLGGAIALRYAYAYPQQVRRLMLIDVAGMLQTTVFTRYLSRLPDHVDQVPLLNPLVRAGSTVLNQISGHLQDLMAGNASTMSALAGSDRARGLLYKDQSQINAALGLVNEDFSPVIRELKLPVRLLWGGRDPVAPLRTGIALAWLLPQAHLDVLPEVGHVPMSDAAAATSAWLLAALREPLPPAPVQDEASQGDGRCKKQNNVVFRGRWRSLSLDRCNNARIEDVMVESLQVRHSSVTMKNVSIHSASVALDVSDSSIIATGMRIEAEQAWRLEHSRVDMAAFTLAAPKLGSQKGGSRLFLSLGHWCDGDADWRLHGVWTPSNGELDAQLRSRRDGDCRRDAAPGSP